jgi:hypothetical protein
MLLRMRVQTHAGRARPLHRIRAGVVVDPPKTKKAATVSRGGFLIAEGSSAKLFDRDEVLSFAGLAVTYSSKP